MTTRRTAVAAYLVLGVTWGLSFLFMAVALEVVTPGQTALLRVVFGAVPVSVFALKRGDLRLTHWRHAHHFVVMSLLAAGLYYYSFAAGTQRLDSGVAGALSGTIPLFATVGAAALLSAERLTPGRVAGLCVGSGGVIFLAQPWSATSVDPQGIAWMLLGCASLGLSFAYARRFITPLGIPSAASATYQMGLAAIGLTLFTDLRGLTEIAEDPRTLLATVLGLGMLCTGVAFVLYYVAVDGLGASTASTATYIPPVVAMGIGVTVLGEPLHPWAALGLLLVVIGALISHRSRPAGATSKNLRSGDGKEVTEADEPRMRA